MRWRDCHAAVAVASGIGARVIELSECGRECIVDAPEVGKQLADHLIMPLIYQRPSERFPPVQRLVILRGGNTLAQDRWRPTWPKPAACLKQAEVSLVSCISHRRTIYCIPANAVPRR